MNVFIVGLGLIGASYAEKLSKGHFTVFGYDHDETVMQKAKDANIIHNTSDLYAYEKADLIISALYPDATLQFFKQHGARFKATQTLTDVAGVKTALLKAIDSTLPANIGYLSHHPMAGKAVPGFDAKEANLFKGMHFLIIKSNRSRAIDHKRIHTLANALEVGFVSTMSAKEHDTRIAFTSQLTHVLATTLMHSEPALDTTKSTGDSFRDLTRIANINAPLWAELFTQNEACLTEAIERFELALKTIKKAIKDCDMETLHAFLKLAKARRKAYD